METNSDMWAILAAVGSFVAAVAAVAAAIFSFWLHSFERRRRRFDILEQSFDVLQRVNEKALESDDNLCAAILSGNPGDKTSVEEARIVYFHYMRINRMFRAYEYMKGGYLSEADADRIIKPHLGTLKPVMPKLRAILARGYPPDFIEYLLGRVSSAALLPVITGPG